MGKGSRSREAARANTASPASAPRSTGAKIRNILIGVVAVAFVLIAAYGALSKTGFTQRMITAMEVGEIKVNALDYHIYYVDSRMQLIANSGSILEAYFGVDLSKPLETQPYGSEGQTWGDYLHTQTQSTIEEIAYLSMEAEKNGYVFSEEDQKSLDAYMASYATAAETYEMTEDAYITAAFGSYVKSSDLERVAKQRIIASAYRAQIIDSLSYTDAEITAYYNENRNDFDYASYRYFSIPYKAVTYTAPADGAEVKEGEPKSEEEATAMTEANRQVALAAAEAFRADVTDQASFIAAALAHAPAESKSYYEDDSYTLEENVALAEATGKMGDWYKDAARVPGEIGQVDTGTSVVVMLFIERHRPEVATATVRHLLLSLETPEADATDAEKAEIETRNAEVKTKVEALYQEWKDGEHTEDSFGVLAAANSEDTGSKANGGKYTEFKEGSMTAEFNDWAFDPARKYGDNAIVQTSYGYHIMFYVAPGRTGWIVDADNALLNNAYSKMSEQWELSYITEHHKFGENLAY